jgi:dTDP-4-amino-4,6-dideoxygalactose transaminase
MNNFILKKSFNSDRFNYYLQDAIKTNQFTNYGTSVQLLEQRAKNMLKIDDSKAVIATVNGAMALNAIVYAMSRQDEKAYRVSTQDFTFPCNSQGAAQGAIIADIDSKLQFNIVDDYVQGYSDMVIVTNCFGHLQDLDYIQQYTIKKGKKLILDNAASPYSFWYGTNSCNIGNASFVSLHHTKPIGFGEGGLVIIDKEYEESVRVAINFGFIEGAFNERGGNFKMSELSAAGILQWWDSFDSDIESLAVSFVNSYYDTRYNNRLLDGFVFPHAGSDDDIFFPNCLPFIHTEPKKIEDYVGSDVKKYYKPLRGMQNSQYVFDRIICFGIAND